MRDDFKEYRGLTKEEAFAKIMTGIEVVDVQNLKVIMKYVKDNREFIADFNTEDNTIYFSYQKVWGIFQEELEMSYDDARLFLYEKVKEMFGWTLVPYERGGYNFG